MVGLAPRDAVEQLVLGHRGVALQAGGQRPGQPAALRVAQQLHQHAPQIAEGQGPEEARLERFLAEVVQHPRRSGPAAPRTPAGSPGRRDPPAFAADVIEVRRQDLVLEMVADRAPQPLGNPPGAEHRAEHARQLEEERAVGLLGSNFVGAWSSRRVVAEHGFEIVLQGAVAPEQSARARSGSA